MKKKLQFLLSLSLTLVLSLSLPATAYASSASSATTKQIVYGYTYYFYAQVCNDRYTSWAYTCIDAESSVPTGYMGAYAALYSSDDILMVSGSWYYNKSAGNSCVADSGLYKTKGQYYSYGKVKFYEGNSYSPDYATNKSPIVSNLTRASSDGFSSNNSNYVVAAYNINENGETYGRAGNNALLLGEEPDLIAAYGNEGTLGYVRAIDLDSRVPKTPEEAIAISIENSKGRTVNLYGSDGVTIIGTFSISPNYNY